MKTSFLLILLFIASFESRSHAQLTPITSGFLKSPPLELIGEVDETALYVRTFDFYKSNILDLYTVENNQFLKKETIALPEDYIYQVFIYNNEFFLFVSDFKTGDYSMLQLDSDLNEVNRIKLLDKKEAFSVKDVSIKDNVPQYFRYFQKDNKVGISIKRTQNRFIVADLESMTSAAHISDLKKDEEYSIDDCLFGDGLDAIFALGTYNDYEALIICKEQNHRNVIIPFTDKKTGDYRRSFKFVSTPEGDYLASLYINKSKKEQGYSLTPIPNFSFTTLELLCFPDQTLNNPAIWTEGQYKKVQTGNIPVKNYTFSLVSAEFVDGFLLLQSQIRLTGANNVLISRIDLELDTPKVSWTFLSHFNVDYYLGYTTKLGDHNFISFIRNKQLHVLYNVQVNHIASSSEPNLKDKEAIVIGESTFQKVDSRVVQSTINLTNGEFTSKTSEPFEGSSFKGKITNPSYHIKDAELTYLLYKTDFVTQQFSEPTIVSIPLD